LFDDRGVSLGYERRLQAVVREKGGFVGTEEVPLASFCIQWLEEKGRPMRVLELGKLSSDYLTLFLESRPHIAWPYHMGCRGYEKAATAAVDHASGEPKAATAKTLLSMAKLSALLTPSAIDKEYVCISTTDAAREAAANLSVLAAQAIVTTGDDRECQGDRLPASVIIGICIYMYMCKYIY
jgi:hypothetical protein